jgi:transposase
MKQATPEPEELGAYIGLDWADQAHVISLRSAGSNKVERYKLTHTPEALTEWVSDLQQRFPGQRVAVALEQSRGAVVHALMGYDFLVLYPVNPKTLAKYREAFSPSGAKDDPTDGDLLLELVTLHRDKLRAWVPDDEQTRTITLLVEYRRQLVASQTRLSNRLTSLLKLYYPQALGWAGELTTVQACDFLQHWPTLAQVQQVTSTKLRKFYIAHGCRKPEVIEQRLQEIKVGQPLTRDGAVLTASVAMVQATISQLRPVLEAIAGMDKQITGLFAQHPDHDLFSSFPGAGPVFAPRLLAAMGADRGRFEAASEVRCVVWPIDGSESSIAVGNCASLIASRLTAAPCSGGNLLWLEFYHFKCRKRDKRTAKNNLTDQLRCLTCKFPRLVWCSEEPCDLI